jgi:hypothetical protein
MTTTSRAMPSRHSDPTSVRSHLGPAAWVRSFPRAVRLLLARRIRLRTQRVGRPLTMSDGHVFVPFRETVATAPRRAGVTPAVLHPRFRLRGMGRPGSLRNRIFRRLCIVTTPFFVGLDGFRSKLWMYDPATDVYAGLYDWDDPAAASAYATGLCRVLRLVSKPGSVSSELVGDLDVDTYLSLAATGASATPAVASPWSEPSAEVSPFR